MKTYDFRLVLQELPEDEDVWDRVYGRCDDCSIGQTCGVGSIDFHRDARTLEEAVTTAVRDVVAEGLVVERIELEPASLVAAA